MKNIRKHASMVDYYQKNQFNPVPFAIENKKVWNGLILNRKNLYERHLGIPFLTFKGKSVLEFGCNSGENSLVLADAGAKLTLVEPNGQALPRLEMLFDKFGLSQNIVSLEQCGIADYSSSKKFDIVLAEGFLFSLPNREEMIEKISKLLVPGGIGVISFNDRYGALVELIKRAVLWRACELKSVDPQDHESLEIAQTLFGYDFSKLQSTRPFEAWWKDMLVQPFIIDKYFWSFQELLPLLQVSGLETLSTSPKWILNGHFNWYKNRPEAKEINKRALSDWARVLPFIISGRKMDGTSAQPASDDVINAVAGLTKTISDYASDEARAGALDAISYPELFDEYLTGFDNENLERLSDDIRNIITALKTGNYNCLMVEYEKAQVLRSNWGAPYHYLSFVKT